MSLTPFNGSIANPAQSEFDLNSNNISNVGTLSVSGTTSTSDITITNNTNLQTINFNSSNPSYPSTATVSYNSQFNIFTIDTANPDGACNVNVPVTINSDSQALTCYGGNGVGLEVRGSTGATAQYPAIRFTTYSGAGNVATMFYETDNDLFGVNKNFTLSNELQSTCSFSMIAASEALDKAMVTTVSSGTGLRTYTQAGENTFIFGATGATGATPYLKLDGVLGESRVYDTVYNPVPSVQTYGQFSLNTTFNIGSTGGTAAGVADTATQVSLDTDVISEGCSLVNGGIEVLNSGKYNITVSPQFFNTGSGNHNVYFWFRVNSTDVANSATGVYLSGNGAQQVPTVSVVLDLTAADVVKIMAAADDDEIQCLNVGAISTPYVRPAAPAIIATIVRVA